MIRAHDIAETRDYVTILAALNGWTEVDPELRIADEIRREPANEWSESPVIPESETTRQP